MRLAGSSSPTALRFLAHPPLRTRRSRLQPFRIAPGQTERRLSALTGLDSRHHGMRAAKTYHVQQTEGAVLLPQGSLAHSRAARCHLLDPHPCRLAGCLRQNCPWNVPCRFEKSFESLAVVYTHEGVQRLGGSSCARISATTY